MQKYDYSAVRPKHHCSFFVFLTERTADMCMPHMRKSMRDDQKDGRPPVYKVKYSLCELDGSLNGT